MSIKRKTIILAIAALAFIVCWVIGMTFIMNIRYHLAHGGMRNFLIRMYLFIGIAGIGGAIVAYQLSEGGKGAAIAAFFFPEFVLPVLVLIKIFDVFPITKRARTYLLMEVIMARDEPKIKKLLTKSIDLSAQNPDGESPLYLAANMGLKDAVVSLIDKKADINAKRKDGWTPLIAAAYNGNTEIMNLLIAGGASIKIRNNKQATPLHIAVYNKQMEAVRLLVEKKADLNAADNEGFTPLMAGAKKGHLPVVEFLVSSGVSVNAESKNGITPLYAAVCNNQLETTRYLIEKGADLNYIDKKGFSLLDKALLNKFNSMAEELQKHGATKNKAEQIITQKAKVDGTNEKKQKHVETATFNDLQTSSPKAAIDNLFEKALPLIPELSVEAIQTHYNGFIIPWGSKMLISGTKTELYDKVLYNLEWTAREPGFHYFTVHVRPQMALAQIIAWADDKGASVCIWRSKDSFYLCGNMFFRYD